MVFFAAHLRAKGEEFRAALSPADRRLLRASKVALAREREACEIGKQVC